MATIGKLGGEARSQGRAGQQQPPAR
jgi:hypothetical protein